MAYKHTQIAFLHVGNTSTVLALTRENGFSRCTYPTPATSAADLCRTLLADELLSSVEQLYLGGVVPQVLQELSACLSQAPSMPQLQLLDAALASTVLDLRYDPPASLGFDRVCKLLAAHRLLPGQDGVLVDMGTAITVDLLERGSVFLGGLIMPGEQICLDALGQYTALLPHLSVADAPAMDSLQFGQDTLACMYQGVRQMTLGGLDAVLRHGLTRLPGAQVLMTGGGAPGFLNELSHRYRVQHVPDLVLQGMACLAELSPS